LWFEEAISGDPTVNIEDIWTNLNQSELYAQAMLDGGTNEEDILLALNDPDLPLKIEETIDVIHHFRQITQKRWSSQFTSGIGSDLDQRFDLAFLTFNLSADNVETALKKMIAEDLKAFKLTQGLLIVVILILGFVISGLLLRDNARKIESIYALKLIKEDAHSFQNQLQNEAY
jgi:hypothetical protein